MAQFKHLCFWLYSVPRFKKYFQLYKHLSYYRGQKLVLEDHVVLQEFLEYHNSKILDQFRLLIIRCL